MIRGYASCKYHTDVLNKFKDEELVEIPNTAEWSIECPGGGKVTHTNSNEQHHISIFGESTGFGKADHAISKEIIAKDY